MTCLSFQPSAFLFPRVSTVLHPSSLPSLSLFLTGPHHSVTLIHPSAPLTPAIALFRGTNDLPEPGKRRNGQVRKELVWRYGDIYISKIIEQRMATDGWESVKYIEYTVLHSTVADWRYNAAPSEFTPDSISFQLR